jgi:hypothetical protein
MAPIAFLMCVAYDWKQAGRAIASIWDIATEVIVSWDRSGLTWSGHPFEPPTEWNLIDDIRGRLGIAYERIREKLRVISGNFYVPGRGRQALQVQQRLAIAHLARPGVWQVALDADEEFIEPRRFAEHLPAPEPGLGLTVEFRSVYKVIGQTALIFDSDRHFPIAQADPGVFIDGPTRAQHWRPTPGLVLHHHMNRPESDLRLKLASLSPTSYGIDECVDAWKATTMANYLEAARRPGTCYAPDTPLRAIPVQMLRAPSGVALAGIDPAAGRAL